MNLYLLLLGLGAAALLQVSFLPNLAVGGVTPDLMLVLVVGWAVLWDTSSAIAWAAIGGLWLDFLSGSPFGFYTAGLIVAALVAGLGARMFHSGNLLLPLAMVTLATLARSLLQIALLALTGHRLLPLDILVRMLSLEIVANVLIMALIYPLLSALSRAVGRERLSLE